MALARYKDLCIDANDPSLMARFWGDLLGLEVHLHDDGDAHLSGPTPEHTIWINGVPEPRTVKQRVHLDLNVSSVEEVEALGASVQERFPRWTVMADPEGGELCAFVREQPIVQRIYEIGVNTPDSAEASHRIAAWWGDILDAPVVDDAEEGYSWVEPIPGAPFEALVFAPVPEPKSVKNRIHLDLTVGDVEGLVAAGARVLRARDDVIGWTVMADPDGNEFCAFVE